MTSGRIGRRVPAVPTDTPLPYGPGLTRLLAPMRRAFHGVNRWCTAPAIRAGLGPLLGTPLTGSLLLLRTTGRRTGLPREVPLGYAIVAGRVVVLAGFGPTTHWYLNALADPNVEVALPGAVFAGRAEPLLDPEQRRTAFRAVIGSMAAIGRATLGDLTTAGDERVDELATALPLLAITPTAIRPGPYDPGGGFWRVGAVATAAVFAAATVRRRR
jgi:deazaflavin-dependent oxidoreductase (nitroreductase family)